VISCFIIFKQFYHCKILNALEIFNLYAPEKGNQGIEKDVE